MSPFPSLDTVMAAVGKAAVTVALARDGSLPHEAAQPTFGTWLPLSSTEAPSGLDAISIVESRHLMAFAKAALPKLTLGSIVRAPGPEGGAIKTWRVNGIGAGGQPDEIRAFLNPVEPQFP